MPPFFSSALIYRSIKQAVLLQHRGPPCSNAGKWGLFGGHSEIGETPIMTLLRELQEELGMLFSNEGIEELFEFQKPSGLIGHIFLVRTDREKDSFVLGEGQGFDWIPINNVLEYDLTPSAKYSLERFLWCE
mgnify:CR=1 FL=1